MLQKGVCFSVFDMYCLSATSLSKPLLPLPTIQSKARGNELFLSLSWPNPHNLLSSTLSNFSSHLHIHIKHAIAHDWFFRISSNADILMISNGNEHYCERIATSEANKPKVVHRISFSNDIFSLFQRTCIRSALHEHLHVRYTWTSGELLYIRFSSLCRQLFHIVRFENFFSFLSLEIKSTSKDYNPFGNNFLHVRVGCQDRHLSLLLNLFDIQYIYVSRCIEFEMAFSIMNIYADGYQVHTIILSEINIYAKELPRRFWSILTTVQELELIVFYFQVMKERPFIIDFPWNREPCIIPYTLYAFLTQGRVITNDQEEDTSLEKTKCCEETGCKGDQKYLLETMGLPHGPDIVQDLLHRVIAEHPALNHPYLSCMRGDSNALNLPNFPAAILDFAKNYAIYHKYLPSILSFALGKIQSEKHIAELIISLSHEEGVLSENDIENLAEIGVRKEWVYGIPHDVLFDCFMTNLQNKTPTEGDFTLGNTAPGENFNEAICSLIGHYDCSEACLIGALSIGTESTLKYIYPSIISAIERHIPEMTINEYVYLPLHTTVDDVHCEVLNDIGRDILSCLPLSSELEFVHGALTALDARSVLWDALLERALLMS